MILKIIIFISFFSYKSIASDSFYTISFIHLDNNIYSVDGNNLETSSNVINIGFSKVLAKKHHVGFSLFYANSTGNELKNGIQNKKNYSSNGFREPQLSYDYLYKSETIDDGDALKFRFSIIPSFIEKKSGGENSNQAIGGHFISYEALWGHAYSVWSGYMRFIGSRNFRSVDRNLKSETEYSISGYSTYSLNFLGGYRINKKWNIFFSSGIQFVRDIDVQNNKKSSSALIQQGTGTTRVIGVSYETISRRYSLSVRMRKNDFFIDDSIGNYSGEFENFTFNLSATYF